MIFKIGDYVEITNEKDRMFQCKGYIEEINVDHYLIRISGDLLQYFEHELREVANG